MKVFHATIYLVIGFWFLNFASIPVTAQQESSQVAVTNGGLHSNHVG